MFWLWYWHVEVGKIVMMFSADMSSWVHIDNNKKDILILGKRPTDALDDTTLTAEKEYSINFTEQQKKFTIKVTISQIVTYLLTVVKQITSNQMILR